MPGVNIYGPNGPTSLPELIRILEARVVDRFTDQVVEGSKFGDWHFHPGRPFLRLSGFKAAGADPTAGNDSVAAAEEAVSDCADLGVPLILDGRFAFSAIHFPGDENFVTLRRPVKIYGLGTGTIIIDETRLAWKAVFGDDFNTRLTDPADLTGTHLDGVIFEGQGNLNPSTVVNSGQQRCAFAAFKGRGIKVTNIIARKWTGRNLVFMPTGNALNDLRDCLVDELLVEDYGSTYWHDVAVVYLDGLRPVLGNFRVLGIPHADGTWSNAWSPFEVHGQGGLVHHGHIENFAGCGLLVSSRAGDIGGKPLSHRAHHIYGYNVGSGIGLNMQQSASDYDAHDNEFYIDLDQWPHSPEAEYVGLKWRTGYSLQAGALTASRFRAHGKVVYLPWSADPKTAPTGAENGFRWDRPTRNPVDDTNVEVDIEVHNCPASAVRVPQLQSLKGWRINVRGPSRNVGVAKLGAKHQAAVSFGRQIWTGGTRPPGLQNVHVDVDIADDQASASLLSLLHVDEPEAKTVPATTTLGSTTVQMAGTSHDIRSLISHPNLPPGTEITAVQTFAADQFTATAFTVSAAATASGTADATVTTRAPTTDDLRLSYRSRLSDATRTVPPARLPADRSLTIERQDVARFAPVDGDGGATVGSQQVDRGTGIVRTQVTAPHGNLWLPADGDPRRLSIAPALWCDASHMRQWADGEAPTQWTDISGNNRHVPVAAGAPKLYRSGGPNGQPTMRFAVTDAFKLAFALAQPYTVVLIAKHRVLTGIQTWLDGNTLNTGVIQKASDHLLKLYAGAFLVGSAPGTTWFVAAAVVNGASSNLRQNGGAGVTGNAGTATPGGITIGMSGSLANGVDGDAQDVVVYPGVLTVADFNTLSRYAAVKAGVTWTTAT